LHKATNETYTMLASKLHNALMYYLKSREITDDFDALVSLICADRLKELIPKSCLDLLALYTLTWLHMMQVAHLLRHTLQPTVFYPVQSLSDLL